MLFFLLEPRVIAHLLPPLVNGTSNEDPIKLLCTAVITEGIMLASYEFTWLKNDASVNLSDSIYMVLDSYITVYKQLLYFVSYFQITSNNNTSSFTIEENNTNAIEDNGMYSCQITLIIAEIDNFSSVSNYSFVMLEGNAYN